MNPIKSIIQTIEGKAVFRLYEISDAYDHHHQVFYQNEIDEESVGQLLADIKAIYEEVDNWASMQFALKDTDMNKFLKGFSYKKEEDE